MIGYVTLGTNNFEAALKFYDALFSSVGANRLWKHGDMAAWGRSRAEPALCLACPFNGAPASVGNGVMVALKMTNRKAVDTLHAKCLELGGTDEGPPRPTRRSWFLRRIFPGSGWQQTECLCPSVTPGKELADNKILSS